MQDYIPGQAVELFVILRHDIDRRPEMALGMAEMEKDMGIRATYYFRMMPGVFEPGIIKMISDMGHEIGYHYEVLDKAKGDNAKSEQMVNWNNVRLVYGENTLDHIAPHKVSLSEVHNVLEGYFIPTRIIVCGILRYIEKRPRYD